MKGKIQTYEQALLEITENKNVRNEYSHMLADSKIGLNADNVFVWTAGPVCKQFAYTLAERNTGFDISFHKLIKLSGFEHEYYENPYIDKAQIEKLAETQYSIDRGRYEKQQDQIAAIEEILANQRTRWRKKELLDVLYPDPSCQPVVTKQLLLETMDIEKKLEEGVPLSQADHYKIKNRVKDSTATEEEIKLNKVLIAYFKYEASFRDELTWQDIKATQDADAAKVLENAWVRTTMKDPNMIRSYDNNTIRFAGYPEMVKLRLPYLQLLMRLMSHLGFVGPNKKEWITATELESQGDIIRQFTAKMAKLDKRKPKDKSKFNDKGEEVVVDRSLGALFDELRWSGLKLRCDRKRRGPVQTEGKEKGKRERVHCYQFDKDNDDFILAKIKVWIKPSEYERDENGKVLSKKSYFHDVKLSRLLPHYKVKQDLVLLLSDEEEDMVKAIVSTARASAAAAQAAAAAAAAAVASVNILLSIFDRKRGLGEGEGSNESKKQRI